MDINNILKIVKETDDIFFSEKLRNKVSKKGEFDFVTEADKSISEFLHQRLKEEYPEVGFLSEEEKGDIEKSEKYWILDPIDGTTNFIHTLSFCGVSLAYCECGEIILGVIYIPYTGEIFYAKRGEGAFLNGERIFCNKKEKLSDCLAFYEFNAYFKKENKEAMDFAEKIYLNCCDIRTLGSAAVEMAYVACGKGDVFFGRYLKPWDYAAGIVITEEAGGKVLPLEGEINLGNLNTHIVAAPSSVFEEFRKILQSK